jgi:hypothetical protein
LQIYSFTKVVKQLFLLKVVLIHSFFVEKVARKRNVQYYLFSLLVSEASTIKQSKTKKMFIFSKKLTGESYSLKITFRVILKQLKF